MYPLNEINNKLDAFKKDMDWVIDHVQQTWDAVTWLIGFAKKVEPKIDQLDQISIYADVIPGLQAVVSDLRLENQLLRQRQNNTAIIYGNVAIINPGANPPRIEVHSAIGNKFIIEVPQDLFDAAMLTVGIIVKIGARLKNHTTQRGVITIFHATSIEIVQSAVDDITES